MANPFTSKNATYGNGIMPGEWEMQDREVQRQMQMAEKLRNQAEEPLQGQMVSGIYVAPSWTQYLAKALAPLSARKAEETAKAKAADLSAQRMEERQNTLQQFSKALAGTPETASPFQADNPFGEDLGNLQTVTPAVKGSRDAAMSVLGQSRDPQLQNLYMAQMLKGLDPTKPVVVGRSLIDPDTGKTVGVDQTWQSEQQAAREARKAELEAKLADQRTSREEAAALRRELAANASADRRMIAGMVNARQEQKNVPKLPTSALKMQQEELDAIGTSGAINADLGALAKQIEDGKLQLGLVNNLMGKAKNMVGASDESSRNLATFQATLEKLRNDSLRLNKGVQTEGDAQRAWNEMIANINDPNLVKQRLGEIQKINERAANLRRMNVDAIRSNFGVDQMDTGERLNQPPAVGGGASNVDALLKKYGG